MSTVLITGGTGLIGTALTQALLERNHAVIILSRKKKDTPASSNLSYAQWDIKNQTIDLDAIARADYIIHLAGANVGEKRWTEKRKKEIVDSRVKSAELLVKALKENNNRVKAVISASGIDWYNHDPVVPNPNPFTENDPPEDSFLANVCVQWERSIEPVTAMGKRLVILRTGIVFSEKGGAVAELRKPMRFGIAAIIGSGKQMMSWIHIDDIVNLYIAAIENENLSGVYNAVTPRPVSNKELTLHLARSRQRFFIPFHVPPFLLKLIVGEMSIAVLKSCTVSAEKILATGFRFEHPALQ